MHKCYFCWTPVQPYNWFSCSECNDDKHHPLIVCYDCAELEKDKIKKHFGDHNYLGEAQ